MEIAVVVEVVEAVGAAAAHLTCTFSSWSSTRSRRISAWAAWPARRSKYAIRPSTRRQPGSALATTTRSARNGDAAQRISTGRRRSARAAASSNCSGEIVPPTKPVATSSRQTWASSAGVRTASVMSAVTRTPFGARSFAAATLYARAAAAAAWLSAHSAAGASAPSVATLSTWRGARAASPPR